MRRFPVGHAGKVIADCPMATPYAVEDCAGAASGRGHSGVARQFTWSGLPAYVHRNGLANTALK